MKTAALIALALVASTVHATDDIRTGKWEYTTEMQGGGAGGGMPGMNAEQAAAMAEVMKKMPKGMKMPGGMSMGAGPNGGMQITATHCVTEKDLVPRGKEEKDCKVTDQKRSGNTVTWAMRCDKPEGTMEGTGTATYTGDTMSSAVNMHGTADGKPYSMTMNSKGRYLGPCS
jgi:hypothetical protein